MGPYGKIHPIQGRSIFATQHSGAVPSAPNRTVHIELGRLNLMTRDQRAVRALFAKLKRAPLRTFPKLRQELDAPRALGVYVIYDPKGRVAHVGSTPRAAGGIAQRLRNHMQGASSFTKRRLKGDGVQLRGRYRYRCIEVRAKRHRALLEAYAIGSLCPIHIGTGERAS